MTNVEAIKDALKAGTEPRMICMTCPWDRFCLTPPSMTSFDIENQINKMKEEDEKASEKDGTNHFMGAMMGTILFTGKDTQATLCPIVVNRLQTSDGRKIVDSIRDMMQEWED